MEARTQPPISRERRHWEIPSDVLDKGELKAKFKKQIISLLWKWLLCCFYSWFPPLVLCAFDSMGVTFSKWNSVKTCSIVIGINVLFLDRTRGCSQISFIIAFMLSLAKDILSLLCLQTEIPDCWQYLIGYVKSGVTLLARFTHLLSEISFL